MGCHRKYLRESGTAKGETMSESNSVFFCYPVTGELIIEILKKSGAEIPDDAVLMKVVPSNIPTYGFDFVFHSKSRGWETAEGNMIVRSRLNFEGLPTPSAT